MLVALRVFWLVVEAAINHFSSGLAFPVLLVGILVGWRRWSVLWLAPLIVAEAAYAADLFSGASGAGKLPGAMSNGLFQAIVFGLIGLVGGTIGRLLAGRRGPM